jgi:hypothetical protein
MLWLWAAFAVQAVQSAEYKAGHKAVEALICSDSNPFAF